MRAYVIIILVAIGWSGCTSDSGGNRLPDLLVQTGGATLRDTAGEKSKVLINLPAGARLKDLGMVSNFATPVYYGSESMEAPWIKVTSEDGQTGWIFAGMVKPAGVAFEPWFMQKKMQCYLGEPLSRQRNLWCAFQDSLPDEQRLLDHYRRGVSLRSEIINALYKRTEISVLQDYSWMAGLMPGFIFQRINHGTTPYLFADFRYWKQQASKNTGSSDDNLFALYLAAYPVDSIESFFPVWTIQTGDGAGSSQLGTGRHLMIFGQLDALYKVPAPGNRIIPDLKTIRDGLLNDILNEQITYWQPADKIIPEIRQILGSGFACLGVQDRMALKKRIEMFENPAKYEIRLNLRSGI